MSVIKSMRRQKAVWWKRSDTTDQYGSYVFESPVEIKCRWEDSIGEFRNSLGQVMNTKATVYVDREMKPGDKLKKGEMDSSTPEDPTGDPTIIDIVGFQALPDFSARETLYTALL